MPIEQSERIAPMEQDIENARIEKLIDNIHMALKGYKQKINKKRESLANNPSDKEINHYLNKLDSCLRLLKQHLISAAPDDKLNVWKIYSAEIKETSKKIDQLIIPTRLNKAYEVIKTLLRELIALFAPLEGSQLLNKTTETLTSCRFTLFSEIDTMKKSLTPIPEPQTEEPMIGLPQPRI